MAGTPQEIDDFRGRYLGAMCGLEWAIDDLLQAFLELPQWREDIHRAIFLSRLSLGSKIAAVEDIVSYMGITSEFADTLTRLRSAQVLRNVLAHAMGATSPQAPPDNFYFVKIANGSMKLVAVSFEEVDVRSQELASLHTEVQRLGQRIRETEDRDKAMSRLLHEQFRKVAPDSTA